MEFLENVNEEEYETFVKNHKKSHFMQSYYWGEVMKHKHFKPHYVGLKKNGQLVATALLLEKNLKLGYSYFYCPRGYVIDFEDKKLLTTFTNEIKAYAKKMKAIFVKIDPDIKRYDLDPEGNILSKETKVFKYLTDLGYMHTGFNTEFTNEQPRFTFRLNLDRPFEEVYNGIHSTSRKILNKGNQYNFKLYKGTIEDVKYFYQTMEETAEREHLGCNPINYYKNFFGILNKHNMSDLYVLKLNVKDLKDIYNKKLEEIEERLVNLDKNLKVNPKKQENRRNEILIEKKRVLKDLDELNKVKKEEITLSSIMTCKYADKVWTVHGGNATALRNLNANYYVYYNIIKDAHEEGYKLADFFGCSGVANPPKTSSIYGLHNFKKRLGGEYHEFIGEFDLVVNKPLNFVYKLYVSLRKKLRK